VKSFLTWKSSKSEISFDQTTYASTPTIPNKEADEEFTKELFLKESERNHWENVMNRDVDEYIQKDIQEMTKALNELRLSFEEEIETLDEELFKDVVSGLKEDMRNELENLKEQYEEHRREEIEKIRRKYMSKW
jgi:hypothetical protein